jgi:ATP-binding protein involved in chromosome partitioning
MKSETAVTPERVMDALSKVQEPELGKDLVSLGMIRDLAIDGGRVSFTVELTTPACPLREQIERQARQAVASIAGVEEVSVTLGSNVPSDGRSRGLLRLPIRNAVAVASGKGGVGKTTVAVNIAVGLARSGANVGLLDADIYGPNVPMMMGVDRMPPPENGRLIPATAYGVRVMSIGFLVERGQPLIWRGPMLHSAIRQFLSDVEWGELDYLIIDLPPGTGDAQLSLTQTLPLSGGLIVTLPQQVSLEDARRGLETFRSMDVPVLGVIENMSYLELPDGRRLYVFGQGGGERLAKEAGVPFLGSIPMEASVCEGGDAGVPVIIAHPESAVAKSLVAIAEAVAAKVSVNAVRGRNVVPIRMID